VYTEVILTYLLAAPFTNKVGIVEDRSSGLCGKPPISSIDSRRISIGGRKVALLSLVWRFVSKKANTAESWKQLFYEDVCK
jgi:hypothetical protein